MDRLKDGKAWVVFTFNDSTKMTILTTLSETVLRESGVVPKQGFFWDFSKDVFVPYRKDAVEVEIFDKKPEYETEVLKFASRFI